VVLNVHSDDGTFEFQLSNPKLTSTNINIAVFISDMFSLLSNSLQRLEGIILELQLASWPSPIMAIHLPIQARAKERTER